MIPTSRRYAILDYSLLTSSTTSDFLQTSKSSCRRSVGGADRVIVSWDGKSPDSIQGATVYTHSEMLAIVKDKNGDWYSNPDSFV